MIFLLNWAFALFWDVKGELKYFFFLFFFPFFEEIKALKIQIFNSHIYFYSVLPTSCQISLFLLEAIGKGINIQEQFGISGKPGGGCLRSFPWVLESVQNCVALPWLTSFSRNCFGEWIYNAPQEAFCRSGIWLTYTYIHLYGTREWSFSAEADVLSHIGNVYVYIVRFLLAEDFFFFSRKK